MTTQRWDPRQYAQHAGFVPELGRPLLELLLPQPGEQILDVGCGDGRLSQEIAASGCQVWGLDASPEQVAAAQEKGIPACALDAAELDNEAFELPAPWGPAGGRRVVDLYGAFDAVFSNAALHWVRRPQAALSGIGKVLKPTGRFVGELGGQGNVASIELAMDEVLGKRGIDARSLNPWWFPSEEEFRDLLTASGFEVQRLELFARPTPIPGDVIDWLETFSKVFLNSVPEGERKDVLNEARDLLAPQLRDDAGHWTVDYVRLRFAARKRA